MTATQLGAVYEADQFAGTDAGAQINACIAAAIAAGGGRIAELERRMERHEQNWQRAKGFLATASVALAVLEFAVEALFRK